GPRSSVLRLQSSVLGSSVLRPRSSVLRPPFPMATAPAKSDSSALAEAASAAPAADAAPKSGGFKSWIPTIIALVFAPAACWAVAQYVLMPQLKRSLLAEVAEDVPTEG